MTIYDYVDIINDTENIVFTVFNCDSDDVMEFEIEDGLKKELNIDELMESVAADYEIGGIDMWIDNTNRVIHIEFNVCEEVYED